MLRLARIIALDATAWIGIEICRTTLRARSTENVGQHVGQRWERIRVEPCAPTRAVPIARLGR
jgi:uncharacterized protein involved in copper resistance